MTQALSERAQELHRRAFLCMATTAREIRQAKADGQVALVL